MSRIRPLSSIVDRLYARFSSPRTLRITGAIRFTKRFARARSSHRRRYLLVYPLQSSYGRGRSLQRAPRRRPLRLRRERARAENWYEKSVRLFTIAGIYV